MGMNKYKGVHKRSQQCGASSWVSCTSKRVNRQASGPALTSQSLFFLNRSVPPPTPTTTCEPSINSHFTTFLQNMCGTCPWKLLPIWSKLCSALLISTNLHNMNLSSVGDSDVAKRDIRQKNSSGAHSTTPTTASSLTTVFATATANTDESRSSAFVFTKSD